MLLLLLPVFVVLVPVQLSPPAMKTSAALRQHELRAAEDVRAGAVGQRQVAGAEARRRIPDVVDEVSGLLAVGSVP